MKAGWFPVTGWSRISDGLSKNLRHAFLPALSLALGEASVFMRLLRSDLINTLQEEYILFAAVMGVALILRTQRDEHSVSPHDEAGYRRVTRSGRLNPELFARLYACPVEHVRFFECANARAFKFSIPRRTAAGPE